jgi:Na+/H+ antiporter NhaD/arsenite permease-like protein
MLTAGGDVRRYGPRRRGQGTAKLAAWHARPEADYTCTRDDQRGSTAVDRILAFFMGLFIMVGGLVGTGVLEALAHSVAGLADDDLLVLTGALLWNSGVLPGIVDNIPYVASMSPVVAGIVGPDGEPQVLWWALALGADLGGNATLVGASANIVVAGIAARNGTAIGFWQFTRYGLVIAGVTVAVSSVYVWLRYFLLAG